MFKKLLIISTAIIGILSGLYISLAHQSYGQTLPGVSFWHATSTPYVITPTYPSVQFSSSTQPLNPLNGESYYDTGLNLFQFYQNGLWTGLGSGSGGGSASASPPSLSVQYNNGSGILQGSSNLLFLNSATILALNGRLNASTSVITTATITNLTLLNPLTVSNGGTGTNTLASLTSNSSPNLTVTGGQNVLIGTSTQISLGSSVVTSLATGTSGTIFNGSIGANILTLNLPFASALNTGQLLSTDWSTFNSKQAALTAGANISLSGTTISSNTFTQTVCPSGSSVSCNQTGNGTSDQTAINSAITAATPNGTVLLKSGTYTLSGAINMASGVSLQCDGDGTTINTTTTTSQSIYFNGVTNASLVGCHVHDITPDSVGFGITSYRMIEVHNSHNIKIERNTLDNSSGYDIYNTSDSANSTTDVTILNNYIQNNGHQDAIGGGPFVQGNSTTSDITVIGNHIYNKVGNGTIGSNVDPNCFDMVNIIGLVFNGNECHGMVNLSTEKVPDQNIIISNNTLFSNPGATSTSDDIAIIQKTGGIATAIPGQILITNNTLNAGGVRLEGSPTSSIDSVIIANNTIKNASTTAQGVDAIPATDGMYLDYVKNSSISNNIIVSSTSTAAGTIGIKLTANNSFISSQGNTIKDYATGFDMGSVASNQSKSDYYINDTANTANNGSIYTFNSSGFFGIGISSPAYPLQVLGTNSGATFQAIKCQNNATAVNTGCSIDFNDSTADLGTNPTAQIVGVRTASPGGQLNFSTLNTAGSTGVRMFIDNLGNVNIATLTGTSLVMTDGNKNLQSVTLGTNLSFSGTTLNASGSGGSGTISTSTNAIIGHEADWTGLATLGNGAWLDNGTVVGFNATSSTIGVNIQGTGGTNDILNAASSSGTSIFKVFANGNVEVGNGSTSPVNRFEVTSAATNTPAFTIIGTNGQPTFEIRDAGPPTSLNGNTYAGVQSGATASSTAIGNTAFGWSVLKNNTASWNTGFGNATLANNATGTFNTGFGDAALNANTTGSFNTAIGEEALNANTTGKTNTTVGNDSLFKNTTGNFNSTLGAYAFQNHIQGNSNTILGEEAGNNDINSTSTTEVGYQAGFSATSTQSNTFIGNQAAVNLIIGNFNTTLGAFSLFSATSSQQNTAIGYNSLESNVIGNFNTALGLQAGFNDLGSSNLFLGTNAGFNETGSNKLYVANSKSTTLLWGDFANGYININATNTPDNLFVEGTSTSPTANLLVVASSTGSSMFTIAPSGNITVQPLATGTALTILNPSGQTTLALDQTASFSQVNIGTSTTQNIAALWIQNTSSSTAPLLFIATSTGVALDEIDASGHQWTGGTAPTCGTGCSSVTGDDSTMRVVTGSSVTAVTVNFATTWVNPKTGVNISPSCVGSDESGGTTTSDPSTTPSSLTINLSASLTTKNLTVQCRGSTNFTN